MPATVQRGNYLLFNKPKTARPSKRLDMKAAKSSDDAEAHTPPSDLSPAVFVLMGQTGVGKSSFIKLLGGRNIYTGEEPDVGKGINSCTLKPAPYHLALNNRRVILIDTPGFDDSVRDNVEILHDIVSHLWYLARLREQYPVHGVIFLHDISQTRFSGSQKKTLSILKQMCGERCMRNVVVGTTMWAEGNKKKLLAQEKRKDETLKEHWGGIHSTTQLFEDDIQAAMSIITELLSMPPVLLLVQEEMLRPPHSIGDTTVGRGIMSECSKEFKRLEKLGDTEGAEAISGSSKCLEDPADLTFAQIFGLALAAPIVLIPAAVIAIPLGVIYGIVCAIDHLAS